MSSANPIISNTLTNASQSFRTGGRNPRNGAMETVREAQGGNLSNESPPPYSEISPQGCNGDALPSFSPRPTVQSYTHAVRYPLLTDLAKEKKHERRFLYWSLVEIMAVTFSVDPKALLEAMKQSYPAWECGSIEAPSSTLTDDDQARLEELCNLVRNVAGEVKRHQWRAVHKHDKRLLVKLVVEPANELRIDVGYALEVIGRCGYRCVEVRGSKKIKTMFDFWTPLFSAFQPRFTTSMLDLGDTLVSHILFISSLRLGKQESLVFDNSIVTFRKTKGLEALRGTKQLQKHTITFGVTYWPLSDGYSNLATALKPTDSPLYHLKIDRGFRSFFQF
ncbi:hypothetical protein B0J11DRAFT_262037 [Dendryphion nanum]|uniref:Uncharacterized protein n=1 Tax=Dendryphion nanum TaxID=256645 RepID=A0A9P9E1Z1_9PLEO|nr:hypothetical protein B0J11DRAFT_262037 [Dendryphion nanum]